tara:strand:+ start:2165 stop:2947 length:783 start_codon:yes stop_codon:yes gene_type:complete
MMKRRMKMTIPNLAIIDGDIIAYRAAFWADVEGIEELESRLQQDIDNWTPSDCSEVLVALSCKRKNNFRKDFWSSYKEHRNSVSSPESLGYCKELLWDMFDSIEEPRLEADDLMGIYISKGDAIGITIDKDLRTIPGYHWNPDKEKNPVHVTEEEADFFFHQQWMQGDSTDGIPGLWRVGPKKAIKFINSIIEEDGDVIEAIFNEYDTEKRPNELEMDTYDFALSMARCVRILRDGEYDFETKEIKLWEPKVGYSDSKET